MLRLPLMLTGAGLLHAQAIVRQVAVQAGPVQRTASPALAEFAWPEPLAPAVAILDTDRPTAWQAKLTDDTGARVPCEVLAHPGSEGAPVRGSLRFLVVGLAAGGNRSYRLELGAAPIAPPDDRAPFATAEQADRRELLRDGKPLLRHEFAFDRADLERTDKPIWHLVLPGSDVLLTKGAGGEYSHHRGLFLGWNTTTVGDATFDFWHCQKAGQRHAGVDLTREVRSTVRGEIAAVTHWLSPLDEVVVREHRVVTVWERAGGADGATPTVIDVALDLSSDRAVALRGDPQHAGFQLRVAEEVAQRKDARYVRPTSAQGGKDDVWHDCPWVAGLFTIAGHDVAIAHMSHPSNPQPVAYSTRDYGRFGAFFAADIDRGAPLQLRYRLLVIARTPATDTSAERFARDYADFVTPMVVTVTE